MTRRPGSDDAKPAVTGPADPFAAAADRGAPFQVAAIEAPWGPIHVAASRRAIVGLAVLSPREPFVQDVTRRRGGSIVGGPGGPMLDRMGVRHEIVSTRNLNYE